MGLWWPPAATYMRPGASPQSRRYVYTGPGVHWSLTPPGPRWPPAWNWISKWKSNKKIQTCQHQKATSSGRSRSFTSIQMFHTHTRARNCHCEFCWEPLGTSSSEPWGTLLGNLWEPLPRNLWEPGLGTLLGNLFLGPFLGTLLGNLLLGTCSWEPLISSDMFLLFVHMVS